MINFTKIKGVWVQLDSYKSAPGIIESVLLRIIKYIRRR